MKKVLFIAVLTALLSGCQLLPLVSQNTSPKTETISPEQQKVFQKLDEQFEKLKTSGIEIDFNGEKFVKLTRAVNGSEPRFVSFALNMAPEHRKAILSDTFYLKEVNLEPTLTARFLAKNKTTCDLKPIGGVVPYYACDSDKFKRYIAVIHKEKNIVSYRSFTSYQQKLTPEQESAIVNALDRYPLDAISYSYE